MIRKYRRPFVVVLLLVLLIRPGFGQAESIKDIKMKVLSFNCSEVQDKLDVIKVCVYSGFKVFTGIIELEDTELDVAAITFAEQVAEQNNLSWYDFEIQEFYK
ncbi:hypothetical protein AI2716V1_0380 [Enterobacter cloacae]|nr:hypothetical protein AI2716V1_0380 [Enterobacter cloacae]CAH3342211.1 hypothetical protein AI2716V1_0380 [Enterobacter cloacae]